MRPSDRPVVRPLAALLYGWALLGAIAAPSLAPVPAAAEALSAEETAEIRALAAEALPRLVVHDAPRGPYATGFRDGAGQDLTLDRFRGRIVVLNVWATWCPPCREEMPSLDALAGGMRGEGVEVVALSTDRGGAERVRAFYAEEGIEDLPVYVDAPNRFAREAAILGLPVTMILDREGREIARLTGDADWNAAPVRRMLRRLAQLTRPNDGLPRFRRAPAAGTAL